MYDPEPNELTTRTDLYTAYLRLHAAGILHRDAESRNWCCGTDGTDRQGKMSIVDFGQSRIWDPASAVFQSGSRTELMNVASELKLGQKEVEAARARWQALSSSA